VAAPAIDTGKAFIHRSVGRNDLWTKPCDT